MQNHLPSTDGIRACKSRVSKDRSIFFSFSLSPDVCFHGYTCTNFTRELRQISVARISLLLHVEGWQGMLRDTNAS